MLTKAEFNKRNRASENTKPVKEIRPETVPAANDYAQTVLIFLLVIAAFILGIMYTKINILN